MLSTKRLVPLLSSYILVLKMSLRATVDEYWDGRGYGIAYSGLVPRRPKSGKSSVEMRHVPPKIQI
jgi:hypothetical protein